MISELIYIGKKHNELTYGKKYITLSSKYSDLFSGFKDLFCLYNDRGKYLYYHKKYFVDCAGFRDLKIDSVCKKELPWWNFWTKGVN